MLMHVSICMYGRSDGALSAPPWALYVPLPAGESLQQPSTPAKETLSVATVVENTWVWLRFSMELRGGDSDLLMPATAL